MLTLVIAVGALVGYVIAYNTYGRWLARKIFHLDPTAEVPSVELNDDTDYVPTAKTVVFGHHFTSIAGTGPIVGPAIAIMWGWVPALLWVLFGSIFIGAVHDFGALVISLRNRGQTIGDIAGRMLNPRVRFLFLSILLFGLWIVLAIFGLVIASVFQMFPESILPVFLQIPIAVMIGIWLHHKGVNLLGPSAFALALMYCTVWLGAGCPGMAGGGGSLGEIVRTVDARLATWPIWVWAAVLLGYCYIASVLPVWLLLQPRDFINSLQLISSLGLILIGLIVAGTHGAGGQPVEFVAPTFQMHPLNAPPMLPVLFITIACGAVSGFHCLVSSGTTSKQLKCETDAQFVGYGSMLTEGFLAVLVILAVSAGIGMGWPDKFAGQSGTQLWHSIYHDWNTANGLSTKIGAFVVGSANFLQCYGINREIARAIMGVLVASFAGTTLDTATRLQRYVVQELSRVITDGAQRISSRSQPTLTDTSGFGRQIFRCPSRALSMLAQLLHNIARPLMNPHGATLFAVVTAFGLAIFPKSGDPWAWDTIGKGGLILWPMFGATNQLLGGLAFLVICFWLWRRNKPIWYVALPTVFMLIMPAWAMLVQLRGWWDLDKGWWKEESYLLVCIAMVTLGLEVWMIVEAVLMWPRAKGVLEEALPPLEKKSPLPTTATSAVGPNC